MTKLWNRSYENLVEKGLVSYLDGGGANVPAEPPLTFGSHRSKLVERIRKDRGKKNLKWKDQPDFRPLPLPWVE